MARGLADRLLRLLRIGRRVESHVPTPAAPALPLRIRQPTDHVILLDGTLAAHGPGHETNIGQIYQMLRTIHAARRTTLYYEAGVQWHVWRDTPNVAMGRGINRQIRRVYGWLASHYHPGDRIFLFGYSRGAFAVRSLAGVIDRVGLLRADAATERNVQLAYRYYQTADHPPAEAEFVRRFCHPQIEIEMIGVFDTVKALGVRLPFLWMWTEPHHDFHSHALSGIVRSGYHALALDETRAAFDPILWETTHGDWSNRVEQVWFRGVHGDIGGQVSHMPQSRPLANIPLIWMAERAERHGLTLPDGWRKSLPIDPFAPSVGTLHGWGKAFLLRSRRRVGRDPSERIHPSAAISRRGRFWAARIPTLVEQQ